MRGKLSGVLQGYANALLENNRLGWKGLLDINVLAYLASFIFYIVILVGKARSLPKGDHFSIG